MIRSFYRLVPMCIIFTLFFFSCSRTPEEIFNRAVEKYTRKQDPESRLIIENRFMQDLGAVQIDDAEKYIPGSHAVIVQNDETYTVFTSDGYSEPWQTPVEFALYNPPTGRLCVSDGFSASLYRFSRDEENIEHISRIRDVYLTSDDKTPVDSLFASNDNLYFFYKNQIHEINLSTEEKRVVSKDKGKEITLSPPYDKFAFKTSIRLDSNLIGACLGDGGKYNLYIFDINTESLLLKKKVPARFFIIRQNHVLYMTGKSGKWSLVSYSFSDESESEIKEFEQLKDISESADKFFYVDSEGYHITDKSFSSVYNENPMLKIDRIVNDYLIVEFKKEKYLVSTPLYFSVTDSYQALVPGFFSHNPGLTADDL